MTALLLAAGGLALWSGATLILSLSRWGTRHTLASRLAPYSVTGATRASSAAGASASSLRQMVHPVVVRWADRLARAFGVDEELTRRLDRIGSPVEPSAFRVRQAWWTTTGGAGGIGLAIAARCPPLLCVGLGAGGGLLAFLIVENQLSRRSAQWQESLFLELPVVAEQLGMLLCAGYSLGAALNRVATRGRGTCAKDIERVCVRVRQGVTEQGALREWAGRAGVEAVDTLVGVLVLSRQSPDLGGLVSAEARSIRRELHRRSVATMEKRSQQVWVPVTVAALVPGIIFLMVPFVQALRAFART